MLNIFNSFKEQFFDVVQKIASANKIEISEKDFANFTVEPTKEKSHGDLACNIAMTMSKKFSHIDSLNNPRKLAEKIISELKNDNIAKIDIAGPGFINLFLKNEIFYDIISQLLKNKSFIFPNLGHSEKINLEYASPNPTGPIHVGHTRGAIYGDVLASLLSKVGFNVLKEYYINDAGSQIMTLIKSAYLRYLEASGEKIEITEGLYPGEYLIEVGKALYSKFQDNIKHKSEEDYIPLIREFVVDEMVEMIKSDLLALGIKHDSYFSEKENLHDQNKIPQTIKILEEQGLIYEGKLETPKTEKGVGAKDFKMPEGYDEKDQTLFKSTSFGDDQDRVVRKADGSYTYFGADLAYIKSKFERGATKFIMPLGYDHAGYIKRLTAATKALTNDKAELKIILCQMVKFVKDGEPLKMSKRAGNFITARQVIEEVSADALRFIMLSRKNDTPFDFDLNKVIEQSKDNPIFYVQYAHARCCSVIRQFHATFENEKLDEINDTVLKNLTDETEIELIKKIISFPRVVELSATTFEPHRINFYLQELSAIFHALWNKGGENPELKFIIKDNLEITKARIYMINALRIVISTGLDIFNIKALEEMR
ncbi:MAG: arginine--tRNA ligase [Pelagibacterales bacterium]|nr:arginine--tRNA ligase [Pelagibacterales bacterium]